ncbi:acylphosphatase [Nitrosophilus labii]|uniref:acylphosphatase n=1 Tax=Nitrosophilus labii TaxID=2706014 RepID=UPI0016575BDC|nr:acylphosphatase [Nitrosophilus labii]
MKTYRFLISGRVQGVWYRKYTKEVADNLDIGGYVRNLPDGRVEVVATLKDEQFEEFLKALKKGPPLARVDNIDIEKFDEIYNGDFEIIR